MDGLSVEVIDFRTLAPILRVTAAGVLLPYSPPLEDYVLPQTGDIVRAVRHLAAY